MTPLLTFVVRQGMRMSRIRLAYNLTASRTCLTVVESQRYVLLTGFSEILNRFQRTSPPPIPRNATFTLPRPNQQVQVPTTTPSIKRIRLIVRKPPPSYSNPRQRPPPPKFGSSLPSFLSSYTTINGQDQTEENLQAMAVEEAALRNKIDVLRIEGRFFPYAEFLKAGSDNSTLTHKEPGRSKDAWDHVVEAVILGGRHGHSKGRHITAQIANKVQAYWDQSAQRVDKAKAQEEKRLRALAKATIKMVTNEWKKAVFYIREQERLHAEAEAMRRGHEHLDAILDQSGQILETQQVELARGETSRSRSRSSSVSAIGRDSDAEMSDSEGSTVEESAEEFAEIEMEEVVEREEGFAVTGEKSEDSDDEEDEHSTRALLGTRQGDLDSDEEPPTKHHKDSDWQDERSHSIVRTPSDFGAEHDDGSTGDPQLTMTTESSNPLDPPLDVNTRAQAPAFGEGHSPGFEELYDDPQRNIPSPTSSVVDRDAVLNDKDVDGQVPEHDMTAQTSLVSSPDALPLELKDQASPQTVPPTSDSQADAAMDVSGSSEARVDGVLAQSSPGVGSEDNVPLDVHMADDAEDVQNEETVDIPDYLKPFAVAPVDWFPEHKIKPPLLLRGTLRPYQQSGLEWLASLHSNNLNGILADEMGLGKTIQTIALLAHLACDRGIWGPHLIIVPTSVLLNWEMEFKKFLPGFKILSYHGTTKRRKELRQGWYNKHHFNVCITSYTLASRDAHIFKRKMWYYMILDEAHMIKNFKSQRWNILLMFRSFRRLLLTGTPLQNNLTELWALLQFLMSGTNFANLKEFGEWFSNPLEKAIEMGTMLDDENLQRVSKLHTVLRPYLLRRLKRDVEKELPSKFEHLVLCPLSKRQRFLYDEFMSRAHTREALQSGVYQKIANVLMQLRKVCNHPDLFEVRPVVTSFAMPRSAVADFEIKELLVRRELLRADGEDNISLELFGLRFIEQQDVPLISALETRRLDATHRLPLVSEIPGEPPPKDTRTITGYLAYRAYQQRVQNVTRWAYFGYVNGLRCARTPIYGQELLRTVRQCGRAILPLPAVDLKMSHMDTATVINSMVKSHEQRAQEASGLVDQFAFVTPTVVALDLPRFVFSGCETVIASSPLNFDSVVHQAVVKLQIAFPNPSLLQYDCGKLQELSLLLREKKAEGHRILIFTQMTRILDILEIFLNFHGYLYLRLDGATKIEDRQYITERFNADPRIFCFISSSRSGGVGINLTGADTVVFYDSDFNPQMDKQCEDRAHRIGQIRDVHIYRFISSHTVEEAMLMKANQKRSLDDLVIQKGEFDWRTLFEDDGALTKALGEFEDTEDAHAAAIAAREEHALEGADQADFGAEGDVDSLDVPASQTNADLEAGARGEGEGEEGDTGEDGEGGAVSDYMIKFVRLDYDFFKDWRL
ncbi:SNF2 family N-terminal domain-containing protein [Phlebopus sp. FC_14]|nr:SNF2 family N-terminal domain-containing protein [Phlebopus sp. FC_14]